MPPPEYVVLGQQILGLVLGFISVSSLANLFYAERKRRVLAWLLFIPTTILWVLVLYWVVAQARDDAAERQWVRDRSDWLNSQIEQLVSEAGDIRYRMLTVYESDKPERERLRELRTVYTPQVGAWRDKALFFLRDELPGARASVGYDFGFGKGTTEWNIAILNGAVLQLIAASNAMETLVSRSRVPRTHKPDTPYRGAHKAPTP